jgi:hypothetical protein
VNSFAECSVQSSSSARIPGVQELGKQLLISRQGWNVLDQNFLLAAADHTCICSVLPGQVKLEQRTSLLLVNFVGMALGHGFARTAAHSTMGLSAYTHNHAGSGATGG